MSYGHADGTTSVNSAAEEITIHSPKTPQRKPRLVVMATAGSAVGVLLRPALIYMSVRNFDVHVISSVAPELDRVRRLPGITVHTLPMRRRMSLMDTISLFRLFALIRNLRPDIVHTHTPKAGLLGMLTAWLARVDTRLLTINGLPSMVETGWRNRLITAADRLACSLASHVWVVSPTLRDIILERRICRADKLIVLGFGSSHGVDLALFDPGIERPKGVIFGSRPLPEGAVVVGFVGRLVRDKGIEDLESAWSRLRSQFPALRLLLCGPFERDNAVPATVRQSFANDDRVHICQATADKMPEIYSRMDICVLPSWREGLPNVCLEAAAMQIPMVATRISGCMDAVQDGVTGLLVEPRNADALADGLRRLIINPALRRQLGIAAREFVHQRFSEELVCGLLFNEYQRLFTQRKCRPGVAGASTIDARFDRLLIRVRSAALLSRLRCFVREVRD